MKTNVTKSDFRDAFQKMDRMNGWSYEGLGALYDYLTEMEEDCGTEIELDVIAYCCEYTEYASLGAFRDDYENADGDAYETINDIEERTSVIMIDDESFIIQQF